jgi:hypothetical protein
MPKIMHWISNPQCNHGQVFREKDNCKKGIQFNKTIAFIDTVDEVLYPKIGETFIVS